MKLNYVIPISCFSFILIIFQCNAFKNNSAEIAYIQANYVRQLPQQNQTILFGHVTVDQGSTHIRANKIYVYRNNQGQTQKIILYGKPAYYRTLNEKSKTPMIAIAKKIVYYPAQHKIILTGNVHIKQNKSLIIGPHFIYNTETQALFSKMQGELTTIIFQPQTSA